MAVLVESAVRIVVLAAVVGVGLRILRVASPAAAHRAWTGVCAVMLALPLIVAWAPEAAIPVLPARTPIAGIDAQPAHSTVAVQPLPVTVVPDPEKVPRRLTWWRIAGVAYATGVAVLLIELAFAWWNARTMLRQATRVRGRLIHPRCVTPVTLGLWSPAVILPPDWVEWHEEDLAVVLTHEQEHVRRRDPLVTFVTLLNRAIFWFHPLAWWLRREIAALSEQACDAVVLSRGYDGARYGAVLLRFARAAAFAGGRITPLGTAMPGAGLVRRLGMLETPSRLPVSTAHTAWITAAYLMAMVICAAASPTRAQTPPAGATGSTEWSTYSSDHFKILYTRDQEQRVTSVAQEAEQAYARLMALLKYDLTHKVPLILVARALPTDERATRELIRQSGALVSQSIVLSVDDPRPDVIVRRLTQALASEIVPDINANAPWLIEGFAGHARGVWNTANLEKVRAAVRSNGIPPVTEMVEAHWGQALFDYIAARSGEEGIRRFFFALRSRTNVGDAIQMALRVPPGEFIQAFDAYVKERFGGR